MSEVYTMFGIDGLFIGIGTLLVLAVLAYLIFQMARMVKSQADKEEKYCLYEELTLDKVAKKKGIDLALELAKRKITKKRDFRKRAEEKVYEEIFGKD